MGLIWLKHPVLWHSSRVPSGYDYTKMTAEQQQLIRTRWHDWYTSDWDYAQPTVAFFCAGIATLLFLNVFSLLRTRRAARRGPTLESRTSNHGTLDRFRAALRFTTARQYHVRAFHWYSPPLSAILGVAGIFVFVMSMMLAVRPYYWPNYEMGHSPPLATRSGWISIAIMPFMIAFATKVNIIGFLTVTSHEKLQVFHRWTALFMYITSLVHTFPFIINNIMMGEMEAQYKTSPWYWTGIAALIPQTYLVVLSWGYFRNAYYETFKKLHYVASAIFMAALFIHVNFRLTSWNYFWATAAIYGVAWLTRLLKTIYNSGIGLHATVESLPDRMIKVSITVPHRLKWTPGQHVFIRFLNVGGLHAFSSHPFTVASIRGKPGEVKNMEVILRVRKGITGALARITQGKTARPVRVFVDGPYGGLHSSLRGYDRVYLIAGGSGATFTLPLLMDLVQGCEDGMVCKQIEFVVAVKENDSVAWMEDDLATARTVMKDGGLNIHIYVTRSKGEISSLKSTMSDDGDQILESHLTGRPNLPDIVRKACQSTSGRVAIVACGPEEFLYDVRNAGAECQLVIADGFGTCKDLFLHTENYSW